MRISLVAPTALLGFLVLPGLLLSTSGPLSAQITGEVIDGEDRPVVGAVVELWNPERRLAGQIIGEDGTFSFAASLAAEASVLRVGRMGFRLLYREIPPGSNHYVLRMEESPIQIRGVEVEAERDFCRRDEDPDARALWEEMRTRYHQGLDTVGIASYLAAVDTLVSRNELGPMPLSEEMLGQRGSSPHLRFSWTRRIQDRGYAFPVRRVESDGPFDSWAYPPLEAGLAPHWVHRLFGREHEFQLLNADDDGWTVGFCPREEDRPHIWGRLHLTPDTALGSVEWHFRTPEPDEEAGGRIFFPVPTAEPGAALPLPSESLVWVRKRDGRFQLSHERYEEWIMAPGDTVPFLPSRKR